MDAKYAYTFDASIRVNAPSPSRDRFKTISRRRLVHEHEPSTKPKKQELRDGSFFDEASTLPVLRYSEYTRSNSVYARVR